MSDYQNSDTAKWDAQEVRKQTSSGQGPKPKKKRRLGWLGYLAGVIVASFLLAGIGWLAVNDVCALNKAPPDRHHRGGKRRLRGDGGHQAEEGGAY